MTTILYTLAFILLLGTTGAYEASSITFGQAIGQIVIAILMIIAGRYAAYRRETR